MVGVRGRWGARGLARLNVRHGRGWSPSVVQELVRPLLERGRRRGCLLIAVRWSMRSVGIAARPTSWAWSAAIAGDRVCAVPIHSGTLLVVLDRRIEHLREERYQGIILADDHRQARLLCGDAIATHRHLSGCGWRGAVPCHVCGLCGAGGTRCRRRPGGCPRLGVAGGSRRSRAQVQHGYLAPSATRVTKVCS